MKSDKNKTVIDHLEYKEHKRETKIIRHQMDTFLRYWPFCPFSLIWVWINCCKQSWGCWFETPSCTLWRHCSDLPICTHRILTFHGGKYICMPEKLDILLLLVQSSTRADKHYWLKMWLEYRIYIYKKTEKYTAHTTVSWYKLKQWKMGHTSDLIMIRQITNILTIIIRKMDKLNTLSPIYCT